MLSSNIRKLIVDTEYQATNSFDVEYNPAFYVSHFPNTFKEVVQNGHLINIIGRGDFKMFFILCYDYRTNTLKY